MFPIIVSIPDMRDQPGPLGRRQPIGRAFSLFVSDEQLETVNRITGTDEDRLSALKSMLRDAAVQQGISFDPDAPTQYGYIPQRSGFWFQNAPDGVPLPPRLEPNSAPSVVPDPQPEEPSRPWWQFWKR